MAFDNIGCGSVNCALRLIANMGLGSIAEAKNQLCEAKSCAKREIAVSEAGYGIGRQ